MYRKILVPLDGSQLAEQVLPHAALVAKAMGAEMALVTVVQPDVGGGEKGYVETLPAAVAERMAAARAEAMLYLDMLRRGLQEQGLAVHLDILEDDVAGAIVRYAEQGEFDLIAMATHARSGFDRFIMGSVADKVIRGTRSPVLLIRALPAAPSLGTWPPEPPAVTL